MTFFHLNKKQMLINFYPDCYGKEMSESDPRFEFMKKD
jgi:hypothetical protein